MKYMTSLFFQLNHGHFKLMKTAQEKLQGEIIKAVVTLADNCVCVGSHHS